MNRETLLTVFSELLYVTLEKKGMKQVDLARAIGSDEASVSSIVNGRSLPSLLRLLKIAEALHVDAWELLPRTNARGCDINR